MDILKDVSVLGFANRVMSLCAKKNISDITNMKVQKICYFAYALFYIKHKKLLFDTSEVMFWKFGPVIPRVYDSLKFHKFEVIQDFIQDTNSLQGEESEFCIVDILNKNEFDNIIEVVNMTLAKLGYKTARQLRDISHSENSAWYKITNNGEKSYERLTENQLPLVEEEVKLLFKDGF
jgi:uncharacterized phage-associated protein